LTILLVAHPLVRRLYDYLSGSHLYTLAPSSSSRSQLTQGLSPSAAADARLDRRASFDYYFAFAFLTALHGFSSLKVLLILYINYKIAKESSREKIPAITWIFNIAVLFANEYFRGYPYASAFRLLGQMNNNWGSWLDNHGGIVSRWEVLFNITILRLISFNMDYYWSLNAGGSSPVEVRFLTV
jgi:protein-cysteine N-palmitoyltransferase HHAT